MPTPLRYSRPMLPQIAQMGSRSNISPAQQAQDRINLQQGRFIENPNAVGDFMDRRGATPQGLQRAANPNIRNQTRELYRDPYEQGNLPDASVEPPRLSYDIVGKPEPITLDDNPPIATMPQPVGLTQDPSTLQIPDFSTSDFTWLNDIMKTVGGTVADYFKNPMAYPAIATALQQYKNSGRYGDDREAYRKEGNPYGEYRDIAAQRLEQLYADPSTIANTPGYKFRLSQGMGNLSGKQAAAHQGWGNEFGAMQNYAQGLASTEYGNEVERLMKQAGVNIGPEASLAAQQHARQLQLQSELGALQALATPFGQNEGDKRNGGGGSGFNPSDLVNGVLKGGTSWGDAATQAIFAGGAAAAKYLAEAIDKGIKFIPLPDGSMIDVEAAARAGGGTLGPGGYPGYPTDPNDPRGDIPTPDELETGPPEQFGPPEPLYPDPGDGSMGPPEFDPFDPQGFDGFFDP